MSDFSHCRSACLTGGHSSWGECAREANIKQMWLGGTGPSLGDQKRFDKTNQDFRKAVADGLNPTGVNDRAIHQAYDQAERG